MDEKSDSTNPPFSIYLHIHGCNLSHNGYTLVLEETFGEGEIVMERKQALTREHRALLEAMIAELEVIGRFREELHYAQHGTTSVYEHSVKVAYASVRLAERLGLRVNYRALVRGALLHDYFLYDWHEKGGHHGLHGFTHGMQAMRNAMRDYRISPLEKNIIARHMFPLTPIPPKYKEAWLVCLADKYCAAVETISGLGSRTKRWVMGGSL